MAYSRSWPYRRSMLTNVRYLLCFVGVLTLSLYLLFWPSDLVLSYFEMIQIPEEMKQKLLLGAFVNGLASNAWETMLYGSLT